MDRPRPKTYAATIEVIFDAWDNENPRVMARSMADTFNCSRGGNCYMDGVLKKLVEYKEECNG